MPQRPRLLDLFAGAGGAAMGYHRAGFDVVGIDIAPQPHYPFMFIQGNAMTYASLVSFRYDAIHASPPCQGYTSMNNRHGSVSPKLIAETREILERSGRPYVIENVSGAKRHLRNPVELTGEMFGLGVHRPRLFEVHPMILGLARPRRQKDPTAVYGKHDQRRLWTRTDGSELHAATLEEASVAMGIDWMTWDEIREAIPPAYTQYIGSQLMVALGHAERARETGDEVQQAGL